jgi:PAS domain S-box-containing protein
MTVCNVIEHSGLTGALDPYEDYAEILFFPFALFFIYALGARIERSGRTQAEARLRESERTLSALMANLPGMAYRCRNDRSWTMEFVSEGCEALTGYKAWELVGNKGRAYADLIAPDDREMVWQVVQEALSGGRPFEIEYRITDAAGREKWVWEKGSGVLAGDGSVKAIEGFITDVTEHKRAEQELTIYRQHLESLVHRRTEELQAARTRLETSLETLRADEEAGKVIQFKLLPAQETSIGGYRFERYLIPSMYLSGDFMDCFAIDDKRTGFYIADVSGHGASSAFVTVLLKIFVRTQLERRRYEGDNTIADPAALLERLNGEIFRENIDKYITVFYGVLDAEKRRLEFGGAGQFPFPVLWREGEAEALRTSGLPIGLVDSARYTNDAREVGDDFVLLLFSDGILEVLPGSSISRKVALVVARWAEDGFDVQRLLTDLGLESAGTLPDDIAFLTVRRDGSGRG